ncbi:MAG: hypothetical protein ACTH0C_12780, partial [Actinomycetaceae bacterium]
TRDPHLGKVMLYQLSHIRAALRGLIGPCGAGRTLPTRQSKTQTNEALREGERCHVLTVRQPGGPWAKVDLR